MLIFLSEGLFSQLSQMPGFNDVYGHLYKDYLLLTIEKNGDISDELKVILRELKETETILKTLHEYKIEYQVS